MLCLRMGDQKRGGGRSSPFPWLQIVSRETCLPQHTCQRTPIYLITELTCYGNHIGMTGLPILPVAPFLTDEDKVVTLE